MWYSFRVCILYSHDCLYCIVLPPIHVLSFQCVCNAQTNGKPIVLPTDSPTAEEDKTNPQPGGGDGIPVIDPKDQCQIHNPESDHFLEPHPYQAMADATGTKTCFAGDGCDDPELCCNVKMCLCRSFTDSDHCVPVL
jgi:hypothetical protein